LDESISLCRRNCSQDWSLGHALIGDFGTSRLEVDDATLTTEAGTVHYAAPEMFNEGELTYKADVFSFGLVLYEILVGSAVFPLRNIPCQS
jgi:serine/threonine protein kinase